MKIYPSLSELHFFYLSFIMKELDPHVDGYHIDIMDSHFVTNLSWGPALVKSIKAYSKKPLWLHFMVTNPEKLLELYLDQNHTYIISIHQETITDWIAIKAYKREGGMFLGIALNPTTDISTVIPFINDIDHILIMTVQPGSSGQPFLTNIWDKIDKAYQLCCEYNPKCIVAVDGGVMLQHITQLRHKKVEMMAAFSAIFGDGVIKSDYQQHDEKNMSNISEYIKTCIDKAKQVKAL